MSVKITNKSKHPLPHYETNGSAGMDVRANLEEPILIPPFGRALVKTGLFLEMQNGIECQVRPRSGLALKHSITVLNTPGTIDAGYRGEIGVILINHGKQAFKITQGMKIAQMVIAPVLHVDIEEVQGLTETRRGEGGFGSTGY